MNSAAHSALESVRVIDLSGTVATEYAAKLFCDYGATVVNLEPEEGFQTRLLLPSYRVLALVRYTPISMPTKKAFADPSRKTI